MLSEERFEFTRDNIDLYLKETAKAYRHLVGKAMPAELILVGGASVLVNYNFRNMTTDIDALIKATSAMKDAINLVRDKYDLPDGWLNSDFKRTVSYTARLSEYSKYYKTYANVLTVRTISAEYLIAMKLRSGRQYKSDLSDVLGILAEHEKACTLINMEQIKQAVTDLYGSWDALPAASQAFIKNVMKQKHFTDLYAEISAAEQTSRSLLIQFNQAYPGVARDKNANEIIDNLHKKNESTESILARLRNQDSPGGHLS